MIGRTASLVLAMALTASTAVAQVRTVDPNNAGTMAAPTRPAPQAEVPPPLADEEPAAPPPRAAGAESRSESPAGPQPIPPASQAEVSARDASSGGTYEEGDVVGAAEGVFG